MQHKHKEDSAVGMGSKDSSYVDGSLVESRASAYQDA